MILETNPIPPDDARSVALLDRWGHDLDHVTDVLARVGITITVDTTPEDTKDKMIRAFGTLLDSDTLPDDLRSLLATITLRWLGAGDLLRVAAACGEDYHAWALADMLTQVECLVGIACDKLAAVN